jgi:hypothetical protein
MVGHDHLHQLFPKLVNLVMFGGRSLILPIEKFNTPRKESGLDRESKFLVWLDFESTGNAILVLGGASSGCIYTGATVGASGLADD